MRRREFFKLIGATVTLPLLSKLSLKPKPEPKFTDGFVKGWVFNEGASFDAHNNINFEEEDFDFTDEDINKWLDDINIK